MATIHTQYYYEGNRARSVDITIEHPNKNTIVLEQVGMCDLDLFKHYIRDPNLGACKIGKGKTCLKRVSQNKAVVKNINDLIEWDISELLEEIPNILNHMMWFRLPA